MTTKQARRILLACLVTASTTSATGCASRGMSLASMNPFSKKSDSGEPGMMSSAGQAFASTTNGAKNAFMTVGSKTKSAMSGTGRSIAGVFGRDDATVDGKKLAEDDPLRLDAKEGEIGSEVFVANGQLWESTGNFPKAMDSYSKAIAANEKDSAALASMARLHFRQGNHKDAATYFQRALSEKPSDAGIHNDLGLTLSRLGQHDAAIKEVQTALQIAPRTSRYVNNLASVQFEAGNSAGAMATLSQANQPAVAHFNMAYLHYRKGDVAQAKTQLTAAMQYESKADTDAAIKRAVDRSRDMLVQIDSVTPSATPTAPALPGASTSPQTRIAQAPVAKPSYVAPKFPGAIPGGVQNVSATAQSKMAGAANVTAPSTAQPGPAVSTNTVATPVSAVLPQLPKATPASAAATAPSQPTNSQPASSQPANSKPASNGMFTLPPGFGG